MATEEIRHIETASNGPAGGHTQYNVNASLIKDIETLEQPLLSNVDKSAIELDPWEQNTLRAAVISLTRRVVGETMASFFVVFAVLAVISNTYGGGVVSTLATSLMGGLSVMIAIFSLGHVSGAHINPAVTIAQTAVNHFPLYMAPLYLLAHTIGAILATFAVEFTCQPDEGILLVTPKTSILKSYCAETLAGFFLLFVASSVYTDARAIGEFAGMAVGSAIAIDVLLVGPVSGGGINPARALGPAIAYWEFENVWIYVAGPIGGGLLGATLYRLLRAGESVTLKKFQNLLHKDIQTHLQDSRNNMLQKSTASSTGSGSSTTDDHLLHGSSSSYSSSPSAGSGRSISNKYVVNKLQAWLPATTTNATSILIPVRMPASPALPGTSTTSCNSSENDDSAPKFNGSVLPKQKQPSFRCTDTVVPLR